MLKKAIKNDKNADRHYEDACNLPLTVPIWQLGIVPTNF